MRLLYRFLKAVFSDVANALDPNPREKPARHPFARFDDSLENFKASGRMHQEAQSLDEAWPELFKEPRSPDEDCSTSHVFPMAKEEPRRLQPVEDLSAGIVYGPASATAPDQKQPGQEADSGGEEPDEESIEADFEAGFADEGSDCDAGGIPGYVG